MHKGEMKIAPLLILNEISIAEMLTIVSFVLNTSTLNSSSIGSNLFSLVFVFVSNWHLFLVIAVHVVIKKGKKASQTIKKE